MIIILGVAGSGKSTQSQLLAQQDGFEWLSMGEILRNSISDSRRDDMLAGKLLGEEEVITILEPILREHGDTSDVILDGFPRGIHQAEWLINERAAKRFDISAVVHLRAHQEAVKERLLARGRQDDTEDAIAERFYEYEHTIKPIIKAMSNSGVPIVEVNAEQEPKAVFNELKNGLHAAKVKL